MLFLAVYCTRRDIAVMGAGSLNRYAFKLPLTENKKYLCKEEASVSAIQLTTLLDRLSNNFLTASFYRTFTPRGWLLLRLRTQNSEKSVELE